MLENGASLQITHRFMCLSEIRIITVTSKATNSNRNGHAAHANRKSNTTGLERAPKN